VLHCSAEVAWQNAVRCTSRVQRSSKVEAYTFAFILTNMV
jgi:hypothetical protein